MKSRNLLFSYQKWRRSRNATCHQQDEDGIIANSALKEAESRNVFVSKAAGEDGSYVTHAGTDENIQRITMIKAKKATNSSGLIFNKIEAIKFQALHQKPELALDPSVNRYLTFWAYLPNPRLLWAADPGKEGLVVPSNPRFGF